MQRAIWILSLAGLCFFAGCTSRAPGTCEKDMQCEGKQVCFEGKCILMKEREQILKEREEAKRPKICEDKDHDGYRAGTDCPKGEALDCNDNDANVNPGKPEVCDEVDNNCDGRINEGFKGCVQTLFGGLTWGTQAEARLDKPAGIVFDPSGFVVVSDNHHLWKVSLEGKAEVLAGSNLFNFADGPGKDARFSFPQGMVRLADGSIVVADCKNNCLRKVSPSGSTSTLAGMCSPATKNVGQYADGPAAQARFYCPASVAPAPDGSLVVADQGNARIRRVASDGQVSTIAGAGPVEIKEGEGQIGFQDGPAAEARFNDPQAVLVDPKGVIYVSESFNCRIRKIDPVKGVVSTLAGDSDTKLGIGGYVDGPGTAAKFNYPHGMTFDEKGNLIVADTGNAVVRLVTPAGQVRTLFGKAGEGKAIDGPIDKARFQAPVDVAVGPGGSLLVVDAMANRVRWIVP